MTLTKQSNAKQKDFRQTFKDYGYKPGVLTSQSAAVLVSTIPECRTRCNCSQTTGIRSCSHRRKHHLKELAFLRTAPFNPCLTLVKLWNFALRGKKSACFILRFPWCERFLNLDLPANPVFSIFSFRVILIDFYLTSTASSLPETDVRRRIFAL